MLAILSSLLGSIVVALATLAFCAVIRAYARVRGGQSARQGRKRLKVKDAN